MDDVNALLIRLFQAHGVPAVASRGSVVVDPDAPPLTGRIVHHDDRGDDHMVQLDVILDLPDGRTLIESFAGWGGTHDQAVAFALHNFSVNSLHVLLAAFYNAPGAHIETELWTIHGQPWRAFLGPFGTMQPGPVPAYLPDGLIPLLDDLLTAEPLVPVPHWARMYYVHLSDGAPVCEVLLDNAPWPEAQHKVTALPWADSDSYYSVRAFTVLLPDT